MDVLPLPTTGIAAVADLRAAGIRDAEVRTAIRRGRLMRVRSGVVARPDCDPSILRAAAVGGRLAGASAARYHGFWSPPRARLVVEVPRGKHVEPGATTVIRGPAGRARFGVSSPAELVAQILRTEPTPFAVATLDSILRSSALSLIDLELAAAWLPPALRDVLRLVDGRAESGTESVVRVVLALAGIHAVPQVRVPFSDLERVDLVIGDRLVLECDSHRHHSSPTDLDRDADRDLLLTALGFHVVRIRYRAAMFDPAAVLSAVHGVVDAGLHLDRSAPSRRATP